MQEEVEMKTVGLVVECVKMTDRILRDAVKAYLRMESPAKEKGKVTSLGKAKKSNIKLSETFLSEKDISEAEKAAEKNGVEITVKDVKGDDGKKIILLRFDDPGKLGNMLSELEKLEHVPERDEKAVPVRSVKEMLGAPLEPGLEPGRSDKGGKEKSAREMMLENLGKLVRRNEERVLEL